MPEFAALIERALRAVERSDSLSVDSVRIRSLAQQLRAAWAGEALLVRCAWCRRFKIGEEWLYLDAVGERQQQIAHRLLATCSHGICPACFDTHTAGLDAERASERGAGARRTGRAGGP